MIIPDQTERITWNSLYQRFTCYSQQGALLATIEYAPQPAEYAEIERQLAAEWLVSGGAFNWIGYTRKPAPIDPPSREAFDTYTTEEVLRQRIADLEAQLAAITAERDELKQAEQALADYLAAHGIDWDQTFIDGIARVVDQRDELRSKVVVLRPTMEAAAMLVDYAFKDKEQYRVIAGNVIADRQAADAKLAALQPAINEVLWKLEAIENDDGHAYSGLAQQAKGTLLKALSSP